MADFNLNDINKRQQQYDDELNAKLEQIGQERLENRERYGIELSDDQYSTINQVIANAENPDEEAHKIGLAITYANELGISIPEAYQNVDSYNEAYFGKEKTTGYRNWWTVVNDALSMGHNNVKIGQLGNELRRAVSAGDTELADSITNQIKAYQSDNELKYDNAPRSWATNVLKNGAQSLPYTGYAAGAAMFGGLIAGPVGEVASWLTSSALMSGQEYVDMMDAGYSHEVAAPFSMISGGAQGLVETLLGQVMTVAGAGGKLFGKKVGNKLTSGAIDKVAEGITKTLQTKLHFGAAKKSIVKPLVEYLFNLPEEGAEEFIQTVISGGLKNAAADKENKIRGAKRTEEEEAIALGKAAGAITDAVADQLTATMQEEYPDLDKEKWSQILSEAKEDFKGGVQGAIALGIIPAATNMLSDAGKVARVKNFAENIQSRSVFIKTMQEERTDANGDTYRLADMFDTKDKAEETALLNDIYDNAEQRRSETNFKSIQDITELNDAAEGYEDPEVDEETGEVKTTPVHRNEQGELDTENVVTENEDGSSHYLYKVGDTTKENKNLIGYIDATINKEGDKITINKFSMADNREDLRYEVYDQFAAANPGMQIDWSPASRHGKDVKNFLIENNLNGKNNGLNYYKDAEDVADSGVRREVAKEVRTNVKNITGNQVPAAVAFMENLAQARGMSLNTWFKKNFAGKMFGDIKELEGVTNEKGEKFEDQAGATNWKTIGNELKAVIYAGENADFSTFVHEVTHVWQEEMSRAAANGDENAIALRDKLETAFNVDKNTHDWRHSKYTFKNGEVNTADEALAYGIEEFLRTGDTGNKDKNLLDTFKEIARFIASAIQSFHNYIDLSPEVMDAYNSMLSGDESYLAKAYRDAMKANREIKEQEQEAEQTKQQQKEEAAAAKEKETEETNFKPEEQQDQEETAEEKPQENIPKPEEIASEVEKQNETTMDATNADILQNVQNANIQDQINTEIEDAVNDAVGEDVITEEEIDALLAGETSLQEKQDIINDIANEAQNKNNGLDFDDSYFQSQKNVSWEQLYNEAIPALDVYPKVEKDRILAELEKNKDTPWYRSVIQGLLVRRDIQTIMGSDEVDLSKLHSMLDVVNEEVTTKGEETLHKVAMGYIDCIKGGKRSIETYLAKAGIIGSADKAVTAINSSTVNCHPSPECAKYCYASAGNYLYLPSTVKSELVTWYIEHYPQDAAKLTIRQFMGMPDWHINRALRLFDKGDISQEWIPYIQALNAKGIYCQIFSKNAELLHKLDPQKNILMFSVDHSNYEECLKPENLDLPIAFVYRGTKDIQYIEDNKERFEKYGGVILPIKEVGKKLLSKEEVDQLPTWAKRYTCPIDAGWKVLKYPKGATIEDIEKLGNIWHCTNCNKDGGGVGCFAGRTVAELRKIKDNILDYTEEELNERITDITNTLTEAAKYAAERGSLSDNMLQLFRNLASISDQILAGYDPEATEGSSSRFNKLNRGESGTNAAGNENTNGFRGQRANTEIDAVRAQYENTENWLKAPNGKETNLTENQWLQVRTSSFKKWFGDWENDPEHASKVLDRNGEPRVVYHGTKHAGFTVFEDYESNDNKHSDAPVGSYWFAADNHQAASYSGTYNEVKEYGEESELYGYPGNYPVFLNIRNPENYDFEGATWNGDTYDKYQLWDLTYTDQWENPVYTKEGYQFFNSREEAEDYAAEIGLEKYEIEENPWLGMSTNEVVDEAMKGWQGNDVDGVIIEHVNDEGPENYFDTGDDTDFIVFNSNQIKSATDNNGNFDANNLDIRFQSSAKINSILESDPIYEIKTSDFNNIGENLKKYAVDYIRQNPQEDAKTEIGQVEITPQGIANSLSHTTYVNKVYAIPAIKTVLEDGAYLGVIRDLDGKVQNNYYFAAPIKIDDNNLVLFIRVKKVTGRSNKFYIHDVFTEEEINKAAPYSGEPNATRRGMRGAALARSIILDYEKNNIIQNDPHPDIRFQSAFHGSAADFEKFDTSKYGLSGEGSMSFGYGTYLTGSESIARDYAQRQKAEKSGEGLSYELEAAQESLEENKQKLEQLGSFEDWKADREKDIESRKKQIEYLKSQGKESKWKEILLQKAIDSIKNQGRYNEERDYLERMVKSSQEQVDEVNQRIEKAKANGDVKRNLYTVTIPDSGYIKWDKNVRPQTIAKVHRALFNRLAYEPDEYGDYSYKGVENELARELNDVFSYEYTGQSLYGTVASYLGGEKKASDFLASIGYVGIDYPAGTNFGNAEEDARNFVIFDDDLIKVIDHIKYQRLQEENANAPQLTRPHFGKDNTKEQQVAAWDLLEKNIDIMDNFYSNLINDEAFKGLHIVYDDGDQELYIHENTKEDKNENKWQISYFDKLGPWSDSHVNSVEEIVRKLTKYPQFVGVMWDDVKKYDRPYYDDIDRGDFEAAAQLLEDYGNKRGIAGPWDPVITDATDITIPPTKRIENQWRTQDDFWSSGNAYSLQFQTQSELYADAMQYDNWKDFMDAYVNDFDPIALEDPDYHSQVPADADAKWYETTWNLAHKIIPDESTNQTEVEAKHEAKKENPVTLDNLFITNMNNTKGMLEGFLSRIYEIRATDFNAPDFLNPADEEEAKYFDDLRKLQQFLNTRLTNVTINTNATHYFNTGSIEPSTRQRILSLIASNPREYRALYSEVMENDRYAVEDNDLPRNYKEKKLRKYGLVSPNADMEQFSIDEITRLSKELDNREIAEKLANKSLRMDDELNNYFNVLKKEVADRTVKLDKLVKETNEDYERLAYDQVRKLLKLREQLEYMQHQWPKQNDKYAKLIDKGFKLTKKYADNKNKRKADYDLVMRQYDDLYSTMEITSEIQQALNRRRDKVALQDELDAKKDELNRISEIKKLRVQLVKRVLRKVPLDKVDYENAKTIIAIQRILEPNLFGGINRWLGTEGPFLSGVIGNIIVDEDYKKEIMAYLDRRAKSSKAFQDFRQLLNETKSMEDFNKWTNKQRKAAIRYLPKEDWIKELNLRELAKYNEDAIDIDIKMVDQEKPIVDENGYTLLGPDGKPLILTTSTLQVDPEVEAMVRAAIGDRMYNNLILRPFAEWTMGEMEELATKINDLYIEGRDTLQAKRLVKQLEAEQIRKRIEDAVKNTGIVINDDDPQDVKERKRDKINKILGLTNSVHGTNADKKNETRINRLLHSYSDATVLRVARILDNYKDGENVNELYRKENDCYNEKQRSINTRAEAIQKIMKDLKIDEQLLNQKITVTDKAYNVNFDFTVDELLYILSANEDYQDNEDAVENGFIPGSLEANDDYAATSRNAVMYGSMFATTADLQLKEQLAQQDKEIQALLDNNDPQVIQLRDAGMLDLKPGTTSYIQQCRSRFTAAVEAAKQLEKDHPELKTLRDRIAEDYAAQYDRMNEVSVRVLNSPVHRVKCYVPLVRLESNGDTNENQVKEDLLGLSGLGKEYVNKGMTQRRVNVAPLHQKPVQMGLYKTWAASVERTEHFIAYTDYVSELNRVYKSRDASYTRNFIESRYGKGMMDYINTYINEVANPNANKVRTAGDELIRTLRGKTAPAYLAWKASAIIKQGATSPWPYMQFVNPAEYLAAAWKLNTSKGKLYDAIRDKSVFMKNRVMDPMNDLIDELSKSSKGNKFTQTLNKVNEKGMAGLEWIDWVCVAPGWYACYLKKYKEVEGHNQDIYDAVKLRLEEENANVDVATSAWKSKDKIEALAMQAMKDDVEKQAVDYADDCTRQCQPSSRSVDLAPLFKNSSEAMKAYLQFQTSLNVIWNNLRYDSVYAVKNKQFFRLGSCIIGYVAAGIMMNAIMSGWPHGDDDDPEEALKQFIWYSTTQFTDSVPMIGSALTTASQKLITGKSDYFGANGTDMTPMVTKFINAATSTGTAIRNKDDEEKAKKAWMKAAQNFADGINMNIGLPVSGVKEITKLAGVDNKEPGLDLDLGSVYGIVDNITGKDK